MIDPHGYLAAAHAAELRRSAAEHRAAADRARRPSMLVRLYARVWWASRPRAERWAPGLLDPSW